MKVEYALFPTQGAIMRSDSDRAVMFCGRGVGKSYVGAHWAARQIMLTPAKGLVLAPVLAQSHEFLAYLTATLSSMGVDHVYNRRPPVSWGACLPDYHAILSCRVPNDPTNIRHVYIGTADNFEAVRSKSIGWAVLDEAALIKHDAYVKAVLPALRGQGADFRYRVLFLTTPRGAGNWVSDLLDDSDYEIHRAPSWENFIEYPMSRIKEFRRNMGRLEFAQEICGEVVNAAEGLMFYEWSRDQMVDTSPLEVAGSEVYITSDQNVAPMTALLCLVQGTTQERHVAVIDEAVVPESAAVAEMCEMLNRVLMRNKVPKTTRVHLTGDASGNSRNVISHKTFYQHMVDNMQQRGWRMTNRTLKTNPSVFKTAEQVNALIRNGQLTVNKRCRTLIKDLSKTRYKKGEMVTDKAHHDPHCGDSLRYLVKRITTTPVAAGNLSLGG